ncbi:MAG: aspartate aminotransferase family protein, partial [Ilumatobacteraceae bacterium]
MTTATDPDEQLRVAHQRYGDRRPNSARLALEAAEVMPGGNTRSVLHFDPFPMRIEHADGATIVDVDGISYIDLLGNYTAGLLGHSPEAIRTAIVDQLDRGWAIGATHPLEIELAELVCERFASIEQVRFTNSGTEANLMAIGAATHHTGRTRVVVFEEGYHGGVLSFAHGVGALNVPFDVGVLPYNDVAALTRFFESDGGEIACVLVEPMQGSGGCVVATPEFLDAVRALTVATGAVLIFDEVMTSRLAWGGAQERFDVRPDMTTLGKYLAGGMTFGAFGGSRSIMSAFDPARGGALTQAGTFNNNVVTMAAGVATMRDVLTPRALTTLNDRGDLLRERLGDLFAAHSSPLSVTGIGSLMNIHAPDAVVQELLFHAMLDAGYYLAPRGMIALSFAVTDADLDGFCTALDDWHAHV